MYYIFIEDILCTMFYIRDSSLEMIADIIIMSGAKEERTSHDKRGDIF